MMWGVFSLVFCDLHCPPFSLLDLPDLKTCRTGETDEPHDDGMSELSDMESEWDPCETPGQVPDLRVDASDCFAGSGDGMRWYIFISKSPGVSSFEGEGTFS